MQVSPPVVTFWEQHDALEVLAWLELAWLVLALDIVVVERVEILG